MPHFAWWPKFSCRPQVLVALALWATMSWMSSVELSAADRPNAAKLLPEEALVYFHVPNTSQLVERFRETATGRMAQDEKLKPLLGSFWQLAVDAYQRVENEINVPLKELLAIPQGEICVALAASPDGVPQVVAWLDCGESLRTVHKLLDRAEQELTNRGVARTVEAVNDVELVMYELPNARQRKLVYLIKDQTLLLSSHPDLAKQVLALWTGKENVNDVKSLVDNRRFTAIMSRSRGAKDEEPQVMWYVDPLEIVRRVGRGNVSAQTGLAIVAGLGLDGIKGIGGSLTFATEEFDGIFHTHLLLETPRKGVVDALALETGEVSPEPWVPADVQTYTTFNWRIRRTYDEVVRLFEMFRGGQGAWDMQVLAPAFERLGVNLERDLIDGLAGRVTMVQWMEKPARLNSQATLIGLQLKDTEASRKVLEKLIEKFPDRLTKKSYGGITYYEAPLGGNRGPNLGEDVLRREVGCIAILDDYLMIANSDKLLQQVIVTKSDPTRSLASELDFKIIVSTIKRQLGDTQAGLISFNRPEEGMRQLYDMATSEALRGRLNTSAENNPFFRGLNNVLNANPLPPFAVFAQYLAPGGAMVTNDETGFHYMAFSLRREK